MKVCVKCAVELNCIKNGIGCDFGEGHVYAGDLYKCPVCGAEFINANTTAHSDRDYDRQSYYLTMKRSHMVCSEQTVEESLKKFRGRNIVENLRKEVKE